MPLIYLGGKVIFDLVSNAKTDTFIEGGLIFNMGIILNRDCQITIPHILERGETHETRNPS